MDISETSKRYKIPIEVLKEYESWSICGDIKKVMGSWQYDDSDLEKLSVIMTLHDIGFNNDEIEQYMRLYVEGPNTASKRMMILNAKRGTALDEIHFKQKQLDRLDYLRYKLKRINESADE